jgi:hypothetical protein
MPTLFTLNNVEYSVEDLAKAASMPFGGAEACIVEHVIKGATVAELTAAGPWLITGCPAMGNSAATKKAYYGQVAKNIIDHAEVKKARAPAAGAGAAELAEAIAEKNTHGKGFKMGDFQSVGDAAILAASSGSLKAKTLLESTTVTLGDYMAGTSTLDFAKDKPLTLTLETPTGGSTSAVQGRWLLTTTAAALHATSSALKRPLRTGC